MILTYGAIERDSANFEDFIATIVPVTYYEL